MSRIGKKIINLPPAVESNVAGDRLTLKGPKGVLTLALHPHITVIQTGKELRVQTLHPEEKKDRALWGLFGSLIVNMIKGVTEGYEKRLELSGIGFKANTQGKILELAIGYSHPVKFIIPEGVEIKVEKELIIVSGTDKNLVGDTAARLRSLKKPEPYKGKGIRYIKEIIRRKAGKTAIKAAA